MIGPGETKYAMGIALVTRQVGRRDRGAVGSVLTQLEGWEAVIDRGKRGSRSGSKAEKEALENESVNDHNARQPAPKASLCRARLSRLDAHKR
jgi:hypothetical protein